MKMVKDLKAKDVVYGGAMIECVVKHKCKNDKITLSNVNGLLITNYHPILVENVWRFPIDVGVNETIECEYVFNFVLSHGHILKVDVFERNEMSQMVQGMAV